MAQVNESRGVKPATNGTVPVMNGSTSYAAKHKLADHFIGGNKLENAAPGPVKDFVAQHDGHTVITSVRPFQYQHSRNMLTTYRS
jgi:acetyl-CoA carboxylase/biotin carboxylase 1